MLRLNIRPAAWPQPHAAGGLSSEEEPGSDACSDQACRGSPAPVLRSAAASPAVNQPSPLRRLLDRSDVYWGSAAGCAEEAPSQGRAVLPRRRLSPLRLHNILPRPVAAGPASNGAAASAGGVSESEVSRGTTWPGSPCRGRMAALLMDDWGPAASIQPGRLPMRSASPLSPAACGAPSPAAATTGWRSGGLRSQSRGSSRRPQRSHTPGSSADEWVRAGAGLRPVIWREQGFTGEVGHSVGSTPRHDAADDADARGDSRNSNSRGPAPPPSSPLAFEEGEVDDKGHYAWGYELRLKQLERERRHLERQRLGGGSCRQQQAQDGRGSQTVAVNDDGSEGSLGSIERPEDAGSWRPGDPIVDAWDRFEQIKARARLARWHMLAPPPGWLSRFAVSGSEAGDDSDASDGSGSYGLPEEVVEETQQWLRSAGLTSASAVAEAASPSLGVAQPLLQRRRPPPVDAVVGDSRRGVEPVSCSSSSSGRDGPAESVGATYGSCLARYSTERVGHSGLSYTMRAGMSAATAAAVAGTATTATSSSSSVVEGPTAARVNAEYQAMQQAFGSAAAESRASQEAGSGSEADAEAGDGIFTRQRGSSRRHAGRSKSSGSSASGGEGLELSPIPPHELKFARPVSLMAPPPTPLALEQPVLQQQQPLPQQSPLLQQQQPVDPSQVQLQPQQPAEQLQSTLQDEESCPADSPPDTLPAEHHGLQEATIDADVGSTEATYRASEGATAAAPEPSLPQVQPPAVPASPPHEALTAATAHATTAVPALAARPGSATLSEPLEWSPGSSWGTASISSLAVARGRSPVLLPSRAAAAAAAAALAASAAAAAGSVGGTAAAEAVCDAPAAAPVQVAEETDASPTAAPVPPAAPLALAGPILSPVEDRAEQQVPSIPDQLQQQQQHEEQQELPIEEQQQGTPALPYSPTFGGTSLLGAWVGSPQVTEQLPASLASPEAPAGVTGDGPAPAAATRSAAASAAAAMLAMVLTETGPDDDRGGDTGHHAPLVLATAPSPSLVMPDHAALEAMFAAAAVFQAPEALTLPEVATAGVQQLSPVQSLQPASAPAAARTSSEPLANDGAGLVVGCAGEEMLQASVDLPGAVPLSPVTKESRGERQPEEEQQQQPEIAKAAIDMPQPPIAVASVSPDDRTAIYQQWASTRASGMAGHTHPTEHAAEPPAVVPAASAEHQTCDRTAAAQEEASPVVPRGSRSGSSSNNDGGSQIAETPPAPIASPGLSMNSSLAGSVASGPASPQDQLPALGRSPLVHNPLFATPRGRTAAAAGVSAAGGVGGAATPLAAACTPGSRVGGTPLVTNPLFSGDEGSEGRGGEDSVPWSPVGGFEARLSAVFTRESPVPAEAEATEAAAEATAAVSMPGASPDGPRLQPLAGGASPPPAAARSSAAAAAALSAASAANGSLVRASGSVRQSSASAQALLSTWAALRARVAQPSAVRSSSAVRVSVESQGSSGSGQEVEQIVTVVAQPHTQPIGGRKTASAAATAPLAADVTTVPSNEKGAQQAKAPLATAPQPVPVAAGGAELLDLYLQQQASQPASPSAVASPLVAAASARSAGSSSLGGTARAALEDSRNTELEAQQQALVAAAEEATTVSEVSEALQQSSRHQQQPVHTEVAADSAALPAPLEMPLPGPEECVSPDAPRTSATQPQGLAAAVASADGEGGDVMGPPDWARMTLTAWPSLGMEGSCCLDAYNLDTFLAAATVGIGAERSTASVEEEPLPQPPPVEASCVEVAGPAATGESLSPALGEAHDAAADGAERVGLPQLDLRAGARLARHRREERRLSGVGADSVTSAEAPPLEQQQGQQQQEEQQQQQLALLTSGIENEGLCPPLQPASSPAAAATPRASHSSLSSPDDDQPGPLSVLRAAYGSSSGSPPGMFDSLPSETAAALIASAWTASPPQLPFGGDIGSAVATVAAGAADKEVDAEPVPHGDWGCGDAAWRGSDDGCGSWQGSDNDDGGASSAWEGGGDAATSRREGAGDSLRGSWAADQGCFSGSLPTSAPTSPQEGKLRRAAAAAAAAAALTRRSPIRRTPRPRGSPSAATPGGGVVATALARAIGSAGKLQAQLEGALVSVDGLMLAYPQLEDRLRQIDGAMLFSGDCDDGEEVASTGGY